MGAGMSDDTYDFDAMITVMANGDTKEEAADKILEHCMEADIACSLHGEGTLNVRSLTTEGKIHKAVYYIIISRSHICSGRDCIGYLVEWNSATQLRCSSCQAICEALNPAQVELNSTGDK